jgi:hypothetical protein
MVAIGRSITHEQVSALAGALPETYQSEIGQFRTYGRN